MQISKELLDLLLPTFIVNHFTFISSSSNEELLHLYFEEKNDATLFKDRGILNYFDNRSTNASAESLMQKLKPLEHN